MGLWNIPMEVLYFGAGFTSCLIMFVLLREL